MINSETIRYGRIYLHPEPNDGAHSGYRGPMILKDYGVLMNSTENEWLFIDGNQHSWEPIGVNTIIPWARIHSIEVGDFYPHA